MSKILVCDDDREIVEAIDIYLTQEGYEVVKAYDGEEALAYARTGEYDGIILDIMIPKPDGLEVLGRLRREGFRTPVLLLTAKSETEDQIKGLDLGADDSLPKPFSMNLLLARVRAMLRRREEYTPDILTCGNISLNRQSYELAGEGGVQVLPRLEYQLMELLMLNQGICLSTETLLVKV